MHVEVLRHVWLANRARQRVHRPLGIGPDTVCGACRRLGLDDAWPCVERRHADLALKLWRRQAPNGVWIGIAPVPPARRVGARVRSIG